MKKKMEDGGKHMSIRPELIDELLKECADPTQLGQAHILNMQDRRVA